MTKEEVFIRELKSYIESLLANAPAVEKQLQDRALQLSGEINALNAVLGKMKEIAQDVDQRYAAQATPTLDSSDESGTRTQGEDPQGETQESDAGEPVNPS